MKAENIIITGYKLYDHREISPSQLGISSRQINYWIDKAILPFAEKQLTEEIVTSAGNKTNAIDKQKKTKWIRLTIAQAVWALIVKELFSFNVSLEALQELAFKVWQKPRQDHFADKVFKGHIDKNPYGLSKDDISSLKSNLEDELLMEHYYRTIINPFTDIIKSAIERTGFPHTMLYVPKNNDHYFHHCNNGLMIDLESAFLQSPMISLPLTPIIAKVLIVEFDNRKKKDLEYLSDVERQIRDIVVFKRPKIVEIAFEDNHIKPIMVTETHKSRMQLSEYILRNKIAIGTKLLIDIRSQDNYKITLIKK